MVNEKLLSQKKDNVYVLTKEDFEDELNRMIRYIGGEIGFDSSVDIKRHARIYITKLLDNN